MSQQNSNWRNTTYLIGAALGLLAGLITAHLYAETAESNHEEGEPVQINASDAFRIGLAAIALVRQISSLGAKKIEG